MTSLLPTGKQINLQLGWPSPSLFPSADLNAGANSVLTDFDAATAALVYGPSQGHMPLRQEVARWLGSVYRNDTEAIPNERICIAAGASQNLVNTLLRFTEPGYTRRIWMVEPTYFLACPVLEDCGFAGRLRGVPEDDEGIDLAFLQKSLAEVEAEHAEKGGPTEPELRTPSSGYEKIYKHIIYVVPTFSNPSGKTMSLQHRYDLVRLAMEYDALIISDDVYDFLCWPNDKTRAADGANIQPPPRLVDINREIDPESKWGNTMSNGSFSKIIAPGARVSWAEATPAFATFLAKTGASISGGNPAQAVSTFVAKMLSSGALETHIQKVLIPCYSARFYTMVNAIEEYLVPLGVRMEPGKAYSSTLRDKNGGETSFNIVGGFFLCINLPETFTDVPKLAKIALEKYELKFAYGKMFEVKGDMGSKTRSDQGFGRTIRLCWSFHNELSIVEGIKRMRDILIDQTALNSSDLRGVMIV